MIFFFSFLFEIEPFKGFDLAADFSNITNYLSSTINTQKKNDEGTATSDKWNTEIYIQM